MKYFALCIGSHHIYQFIFIFYQWSAPEEQKPLRQACCQAGHKVLHITILKYELEHRTDICGAVFVVTGADPAVKERSTYY